VRYNAASTTLEGQTVTYISGSLADPYGITFAADTTNGGLQINLETPEVVYNAKCYLSYLILY
jgi:hypothetical protein